MGVSLSMSKHGGPKLIYAFSKARFFTTCEQGIILFWSETPVALFPNLEVAVNYAYNEFAVLDTNDPHEMEWEDWLE